MHIGDNLLKHNIPARLKEKIKKICFTMVIALIASLLISPLWITITNSFMPRKEVLYYYGAMWENGQLREKPVKSSGIKEVRFLPQAISLEQYSDILFKQQKYLVGFWNALIINIAILGGQVLVSALAAYGFSKLQFRFRNILFKLYILLMLLPFQVTLVPNYIVIQKLGLLNQYGAVIFPEIFAAFGTFLLRQFMLSIPDEYIEAARVNGAGHISIFFKIILPLSIPGIAALALLCLVNNWSMVEQPLVFLNNAEMHPLSVSLTRINKEEIGTAFAASVFYMLPLFLLFLKFRQYIIKGIQYSSFK